MKTLPARLSHLPAKPLAQLASVSTNARQRLLPPVNDKPTFTAIDFETANYFRDSACAVGLVRVERGRIVRRAYHLIRPASRRFTFTGLHGIDWSTVANERSFGELWPHIGSYFAGIDFLAAHNAPFDKSVLLSTCALYGIEPPPLQFKCTLRIARASWALPRATLRHVADHLGLRLNHHHAGSDAETCARIVLRALATEGS